MQLRTRTKQKINEKEV